jgi:hypothetical protein
MTIIIGQQASRLTNLIDRLQQAQRTFWTAKAFHGYISIIMTNALIQSHEQNTPKTLFE